MQQIKEKDQQVTPNQPQKKPLRTSIPAKRYQAEKSGKKERGIKHLFNIGHQSNKINEADVLPGNLGEIVIHLPLGDYRFHFFQFSLDLRMVAENAFVKGHFRHLDNIPQAVEAQKFFREDPAGHSCSQRQ